MNLDLEELYKLRLALSIAVIEKRIDINDPVIQKIADQIKDEEFELQRLPFEKNDRRR